MKKVCFSVFKASLLFGFFVLYGCKGKNDDAAILQQIDEGLVQSNRLTQTSTANILQAWQNKIDDPTTSEKAKLMQPEATAIHTLSVTMLTYIDSLKSLLPRRTSINELATEFYAKLYRFKQATLSVDKRVSEATGPSFVLISMEMDSAKDGKEKFAQLISHSSIPELSVYLNHIRHNIFTAEQKMIRALFEQIAYHVPHHDEFFEAIVAQNAKVLETGATLEITAGMGSFSRYPVAKITIDGHQTPLNEKGLVVYKMKASKKPGFYSIPVEIRFTDQDGNGQTRAMTVNYTTVSTMIK